MTSQFRNTYIPSSVSPPGDTLAELLNEKGMSQKEFAERCGRPEKTINEIIKGKAAITPETALQFERVLGAPAEFWNTRETHYREYLVRKAESERLQNEKNWLNKFPINQMIKFGWIRDYRKNTAEQVIEVLNYFGIASPEQWDVDWKKTSTAFRKSEKCKNSPESISAWLRRGELKASEIHCKNYDKKVFESALIEIRKLTTESDPHIFLPILKEKCSRSGVALVFVPNLQGAPVSGAARWLTPDKALIQLSIRHKTDDHLWFSFFHEAAHILLHSKKRIFIDLSDNEINKFCDIEEEADQFASERLIPAKILTNWIEGVRNFSADNVSAFAKSIRVSPGIVVGRLQHIQKIPRENLNKLKVRYEWEQQA
ncbi:MAG: XRE family transcriptional regulator [Gammaproteobacteria bacterium 39-13]|nr:helix-turn-helix domain-containing protein [Gammaproteobacteria bacterium]OJV94886.1 MAG: XRE family transcriptional regulator [Gammaproteobacteria bacterium 39-13]